MAPSKLPYHLCREGSIGETKEPMSMIGTLEPTDMMHIINKSWQQSFARTDKNKNAIDDRGWNPFNRNLLLHEDICSTMTNKEIQYENDHSNKIITQMAATPQSSTDIDTIDNAHHPEEVIIQVMLES